MPTVRYQIRNEYGLADPGVYRAADKDDPEALLEGVAMAGLVGVLRQLGDLSEFAAEVFHDLHEEVMATSSRSHGLILRVQQLEADFPLIEKTLLCQTDHSHCAYSAGIDWHANLRLDQNLVTQGDMPRFILDSYEECRGPPRLFMLDRFDVAGAGTCLKRYSDPSFFRKETAPSEMMDIEIQREKTARKVKRKGSHCGSNKLTAPFFGPIMDNLQHTTSEHIPEKFPRRHARLKCRNFKVSDISSRKSYMEDLLEEELFDQNDLKMGYHANASKDLESSMVKVLNDIVTDSSVLRKEIPCQSPAEEEGDGKEILEAAPMFARVSQKLYQTSQSANKKSVGPGNNLGGHDFDTASYESYINPPSLQQVKQNNLLADPGFITDDDHDGYRSDDIGSELENYVDALNTMEAEVETDSESRVKSEMVVLHSEIEGTNPDFNGYLELLTQGAKPGFDDTSGNLDKMMDEMPCPSQSTPLVDLPYQQLQHGTALDITASSDMKQGEIDMLVSTVEGAELAQSAHLASPEAFNQKTPSAAMFDSTNGGAFCSSSTVGSTLSLEGNPKDTQMSATHSIEAFSCNEARTPKSNGHIVSSSPPWKINHIVVNPTYKELPNMSCDVLEEVYPIEKSDDSTSATFRKKCDMPYDCSETEDGIVTEKTPVAECFNGSCLTWMDDEMVQTPEKLDADKTDCQSGRMPPTMPIGSTILKSVDMFGVLEIDMQSEDLPNKFSSNYIVDSDENRKELNSGLRLTAKAHELHLQAGEDRASQAFTSNLESFNDEVVNGSEEISSAHGIQDSLLNDHLTGVINLDLTSHFLHQQRDTATSMPTDMANAFQMHEPPEIQLEHTVVKDSEVSVEDFLQDLIDSDICSLGKLSPTSSSLSLVPVSSTLHFKNLAEIVKNGAEEESRNLESQGSFKNLVSEGRETSASPTIQQELECVSDAEEIRESVNIKVKKPLQTDSVNIDLKHLQPEVSESNEINNLRHVNDALELANGSMMLSNGSRSVLLGTKDNNMLAGEVITEVVAVDKDVCLLQCANVSNFIVRLQENTVLEDCASYDPKQHIKESATTRDSTPVLSKDKSYEPLVQDEGHEMDVIVDYTNVELHSGIEEDKICSRENAQHSHLNSDDVIHGNCINGKILSLSPANVSTGDIQVEEGLVFENTSLNQQKLGIEVSECRDDSNLENDIAEVGIQVLSLPLSQYLEASSCAVQLQQDIISENVSSDQLKPKEEEPDISCNMKFESKFLVPLSERGNQEESQPTDFDLSYLYDNNLICLAEDVQAPKSKSFVQCFQAGAGRTEVQSMQYSACEPVDEPSSSSVCRAEENIGTSNIHLDEGCSNGPSGIQNTSMLEEILPELDPLDLLNDGCSNERILPSSRTDEIEQTNVDPSDQLQDIYEHLGTCIAHDILASPQLIADFIIPTWQTSTEEDLLAMPGDLVSSLQQLEVVEEAPPLPPLPPLQWRMDRTQLGAVFAGGSMTSSEMETNPSKFLPNIGNVNASSSPASQIDQHAIPFTSHLEDGIPCISSSAEGQLIENSSFSSMNSPALSQIDQHASPCSQSNIGNVHASSSPALSQIDQHASPFTSHALEDRIPCISSAEGQLIENSSFSSMSPIPVNLNQHPPEAKKIPTSNLSLTASSQEDGKLSHSNIEAERQNAFASAMLPSDVMPQQPNLFKAHNPPAREQRPELAKLLSGLESERSQESSIDRDMVPPLNSIIVMSTTAGGEYQYGYGDYAGYDGQSIQHYNFSASYPVALHNVPPYSYHMFLREGAPSTMYDSMIPEMDCDKPYGKPSSIRNRPRDPLIEAVAAHDKSTLRKISELDPPLTKPKEHERNNLLEQIKTKSFNLKPAATAKPKIVKAPTTNLKVAAILEKANAVRQACMGSDEDDDDGWSDSGKP